jgi:hypothetical protein
MFQLPQDTLELEPTFDDIINVSLAPGTYNVELVVYEVPPGGINRLNDNHLLAKNTVVVTVGN